MYDVKDTREDKLSVNKGFPMTNRELRWRVCSLQMNYSRRFRQVTNLTISLEPDHMAKCSRLSILWKNTGRPDVSTTFSLWLWNGTLIILPHLNIRKHAIPPSMSGTLMEKKKRKEISFLVVTWLVLYFVKWPGVFENRSRVIRLQTVGKLPFNWYSPWIHLYNASHVLNENSDCLVRLGRESTCYISSIIAHAVFPGDQIAWF